jgi:hypothetical protein
VVRVRSRSFAAAVTHCHEGWRIDEGRQSLRGACRSLAGPGDERHLSAHADALGDAQPGVGERQEAQARDHSVID